MQPNTRGSRNSNTRLPPTPDSPSTLVNSMNPTLQAETMSLLKLMNSMKQNLQHCDEAFDVLSQQSRNITSAAPAARDMDLIEDLREELRAHVAEQREQIKRVEELLKQDLRETFFEALERDARKLVSQAIAKVIETKVEEELKSKVPPQVQEYSQTHKIRMLHTETELQNSQARMYNATLAHSESYNEPLRPLLRPLPTPAQSPAYAAGTRNIFTAPTTPFTPFFEEAQRAPSQNFPKTLQDIRELSPEVTKSLINDYGLTPTKSTVQSTGAQQTPVNTKEDDINIFLKHIGMPSVRVIPPPIPKGTTNATKARAMLPPLVISGRHM